MASRTILPSRRRAAICSSPGVGPVQRLRPVQGQAQQARGDPGRRRGIRRGVSRGGSAARTAPASSSTVATPPTSASACLAISAMASSRSRHAA